MQHLPLCEICNHISAAHPRYLWRCHGSQATTSTAKCLPPNHWPGSVGQKVCHKTFKAFVPILQFSFPWIVLHIYNNFFTNWSQSTWLLIEDTKELVKGGQRIYALISFSDTKSAQKESHWLLPRIVSHWEGGRWGEVRNSMSWWENLQGRDFNHPSASLPDVFRRGLLLSFDPEKSPSHSDCRGRRICSITLSPSHILTRLHLHILTSPSLSLSLSHSRGSSV